VRVLSLFDGMSCGRIALARIGIPVTQYIASEIDKYAIKVSRANWNDITHLGCVKIVRQMAEAGVFGHIDLVIGGSPCQGFSFAGEQLAFQDPRSVLFFEFVWTLYALKRHNPNIRFMLENVKMKKQHLDVVSYFLGVQPVCINSALVSAQNRVRYYWCNWPVSQPADRGILLRDIIESGQVEDCHILSDDAMTRMQRKIYSAPQIMPEKTGTLNTKNNSGQLSFDVGTTLIPLTPGEMEYMNRQVADGRNHWDFGHHSDTANDKSAASVANLHKGVPYNAIIVRQYPRGNNPGFEKPMDKCPTLTSSRQEQNLSIGVRRERNLKSLDDKSLTLLSSMYKGEQANGCTLLTDGITYRKLTPIECERLQGVPDNYTAAVSNTQRYKMLGNGWQVDTIEHIFREMLK